MTEAFSPRTRHLLQHGSHPDRHAPPTPPENTRVHPGASPTRTALPVTPTPLIRVTLATAMTIAMAASMSLAAIAAHGAAPASTLTAAAMTDYVHPDVTLVIGGTKAPDGTLDIDYHQPGNKWSNISGSCSGTQAGATSWSCSLPPVGGENRPGANRFEIEQTRPAAALEAVSLKVVVVPFASPKGAAPAPEPEVTPPPTPKPEVTPPPTPQPEITPPPTPQPEVTPPAVPRPNPPAAPRPEPAPQPTERATPPPPAPEPIRQATPPLAPPAPEPQPETVAAVEPEPAIELPTQSFTSEERALAPRASVTEPRRVAETPSALDGFPTYRDILLNPIGLAAASIMSLLYLLLVTVPAEILNSTLEANAHRWRKLTAWTAPLVERMSSVGAWLQSRGLAGPLLVIGTSVAFAFADPNFGFDLASLRLVGSLAIGLLLVIHVPNLITAAIMGRRYRVSSSIITQPSAIIFALVGVIASRLLEFSPGLLVGLIIGLQLAADARAEDQRRAIVVRFAATYAIAVSAWLAYSWLDVVREGTAPTFMSVFLSETLVATTIEGLTALAVAILPLVFLDGRALWTSSKKLWAMIAVPIIFTFTLLVLPSLDALEEDAPLSVWVAIFVGFSIVTAIVWAVFRLIELREERQREERGEEQSDEERAVAVGRGH